MDGTNAPSDVNGVVNTDTYRSISCWLTLHQGTDIYCSDIIEYRFSKYA